MQIVLVFLALLPLALSGRKDMYSFFENLGVQLNKLVHQLSTVVHSGMERSACVTACHPIAGDTDFLCGQACDKALAALPCRK